MAAGGVTRLPAPTAAAPAPPLAPLGRRHRQGICGDSAAAGKPWHDLCGPDRAPRTRLSRVICSSGWDADEETLAMEFEANRHPETGLQDPSQDRQRNPW